jgi:hypothetical protein
MKLSFCDRLELRPVNSTWYRAINPQYLERALKTVHTRKIATRFGPDGGSEEPFDVLYLAANQTVAYYEVNALFGPPTWPIADPENSKYIVLDVRVVLQLVADLTEPKQQSIVDISAQELTGKWDIYPPGEAPTQRLGEALFKTPGLEGFLVLSSKMANCKNLVIFPQKLSEGSIIEYDNTIVGPRKVHRIGRAKARSKQRAM